MRREVEPVAAVLVGNALWAAGRVLDLAMFHFGKRRSVPDRRGGTKEVGEYALHVQCPWRITQGDRVVVGSHDLYYPADYQDVREDVPSEFDWDRDPSRRDRLLAALFQNGTREFMVEEVEVGTAGSLHIVLADGYALDVFPADSLNREQWRLFRPSVDEPHFVVTGTGI